jgi:hypothetical protein
MKSYGVSDEKGREDICSRILRYLGSHPSGLSTDAMASWIRHCTKLGGYTMREYEAALTQLRDSGRIAIANKIWYQRK